MAYLVRHMTHKATTTRTSETTVSVSVEGFKQPITFENIQNIKSPYTPEKIAVITYEIVSGFPDISKRLLNQFKIHVNCWSQAKGSMNASVSPKAWADNNYSRGFIDKVELGVQFNGTLRSVVSFAHELVHVAQFASRRLRLIALRKKGDWVMKKAFAVNGKIIQKGILDKIPYAERAWEWEAFGMEGTLAGAIMRMLGGCSIEMLEYTTNGRPAWKGWSEFCYEARNHLMTLEHYGWEHFDYEIHSAYGEAKQTIGREKVSNQFSFDCIDEQLSSYA
jgi:hypothetical protein